MARGAERDKRAALQEMAENVERETNAAVGEVSVADRAHGEQCRVDER